LANTRSSASAGDDLAEDRVVGLSQCGSESGAAQPGAAAFDQRQPEHRSGEGGDAVAGELVAAVAPAFAADAPSEVGQRGHRQAEGEAAARTAADRS
jgi:hypothetical protein